MTNLVERMAKIVALGRKADCVDEDIAFDVINVVLQDVEEAVRPLREYKNGTGSFNFHEAIDQTLSNIDEMKGEA